MRILQFGATGQLAGELSRHKPADVELQIFDRAACDFADPEMVARVAGEAGKADLIVNAAAYTAVDRAESEKDLAFRVNAQSVGALARAAAERDIPLIHVSTDYVFDGRADRPYREDDATAPLNVYGQSKAAGEDAIRAVHPGHVILRTSWVYGARGANFVNTMLRLGAERDMLRIVDDQTGSPTAAGRIAQVIYAMAARLAGGEDKEMFGTFHYTDSPSTTWRKFAEAIFALAGDWAGTRAQVVPIPSSDYPTPAKRPLYSVLDCGKIASVYGITQQDWHDNLAKTLQTIRDQREAS
jgi:dTDP-4-dehydrorhamnose reductase